MHKDLVIKSMTLAGSSDLTLLAPIKPGLIPSLESMTYKTRTSRLLKTLSAGRASSHEYSLLRPFSDAVERVGKIHSVRVAIVEPDRLLLSVTFDGGWESYLRVLWQKVGTLLDVIFCNTEGYVSAWEHRFDEWAAWVHRVQIETNFFYSMPGLTVDDIQYLRSDELLHRQQAGGVAADLLATRLAVRSAEQLTWACVGPAEPRITKELGRQGLRALALIYRLTNFYLPASPDGDFLHRAARDLLLEFVHLDERHELEPVIQEGRKRFDEQIEWLRKLPAPRSTPMPTLPLETPRPDDAADVQAGILNPYPDNTHGCLLLIAFGDRTAAADFLTALDTWVTRDSAPLPADRPAANVAFTCEGLRAIGLTEAQIALFPEEFRQGMEARASLLGDLRVNHPRRWRLPLRNWARPADESPLAIELAQVHAVVQLRVVGGPASAGETLDPGDPLFKQVTALLDGHPKVEVLSVQPLLRHFNAAGKAHEHFGFADSSAGPVLDPGENGKIYDRNQVQLGEFLLGYANEAEPPEDPDKAPDPVAAHERLAWLHNGSFLVVRKLSQNARALNEAVATASAATHLGKELVFAKMMGRWRSGKALAAGAGKDNDFDYAGEDPPGSMCPFHAHIRRANPRLKDDPDLPPPPGRRTPRLVRRSMSYGPLYKPDDPASAAVPRGLVFMAYNASIAEQFEVVQRWISGGNSAGGYSGQSDPFLGVPPSGAQKYFSFEHKGRVHRVALDGSPDPLDDSRSFVRLEWGAYYFTPSIKALKKLAQVAREQPAAADAPVWLRAEAVAEGWRRIQELRAFEREHGAEKAGDAWKALLEDPEAQSNFDSAGVWAAIRRRCGGVLRTPYGVIVANRERVRQVLENRDGLYSVAGYQERMSQSIGEIYLGLDDQGNGCPYRTQASAVNLVIGTLQKADAFTRTRKAANDVLQALIADEQEIARVFAETRWELNLDVKELVDRVLASLCQQWFGLPSQRCEIQPGGARWDWNPKDPPFYPGHFTAPSRYIFQPRPGQAVEAFGSLYGQALHQAFARLVKRHRDGTDPPDIDSTAPLAQAILAACARRSAADSEMDDLAARTFVGAMMGFLPTVDGNLRLSLNEWLRDGSFWSLRSALADRRSDAPFKNAEELLEPALRRAMQLRPSPELVWRTATRHHKIGDERVRPGDKVVVAIVSATQQCLEEADPDVYAIFGGDRRQARHPPTHACPAYDAAMGVLLGVASALLEVEGSMRPSVAPLALTLEGEMPSVQPPADEHELALAVALDLRVLRTFETRLPTIDLLGEHGGVVTAALTKRVGEGHMLVADGDSWFCYGHYGFGGAPQNIVNHLQIDHGFKVENLAIKSTWLFDFYDDDRAKQLLDCDKAQAGSLRIDRLCNHVKDLVNRGREPTAILLSAGGNDVVEQRLGALLNRQSAGPPQLDRVRFDRLVDGLMQCWLAKTLDRITSECVTAQGTPIPVFIHGYDFPVPDCRYILGLVSPDFAWLYPSFHAMGCVDAPYRAYPTQGVAIMQTLIERLNAMQARVVALPRFSPHVFHVNLTGTISNAPLTYAQDWDNELHPSDPGFARLTQKFADVMVASVPALQA